MGQLVARCFKQQNGRVVMVIKQAGVLAEAKNEGEAIKALHAAGYHDLEIHHPEPKFRQSRSR